MPNNNTRSVKCSFCGKSQENVKKIIAGPGVYICDECINVCQEIIEDEFYEDDEEFDEVSDIFEDMFMPEINCDPDNN